MNFEQMMRNNGKKELAKFLIFINRRLVYWTNDEMDAQNKLSLAKNAGLDARLICA